MDKTKVTIGPEDALTLIDGQNDFILPTGALFVVGVEGETKNNEIIRRICALWPKFKNWRVTTEDYHPPKNQAHAQKHVEYAIFGSHCIVDTEGQKYHHGLMQLYKQADQNLLKGMDPDIIAYSLATSQFFGDHISNLRRQQIKRVFVVGWAFTHCVGESAIAYATQGFETYVIRDLTRSVPPPYGDPETMLKKLELYGVKLITSDQIA